MNADDADHHGFSTLITRAQNPEPASGDEQFVSKKYGEYKREAI